MAGFSAPKEWREVLREESGPLLGGLIFRAWIVGATAASLTAISIFAYGVFTWIVKPISGRLPQAAFPQPSSWIDITISLVITATFLGIGFYVFHRRVEKSRQIDFDILDGFFTDRLFPRIQKLEQHAASVDSVESYCKALEADIKELEAHVQFHTPLPLSLRGLVRQQLRGIRSVGKIQDDTKTT